MSKTIYKINDKPSGTPYDDAPLKARVTALENKPDNDKQTLTFTEGNRNLSISNGNTVTLPDYLKKDDAYALFPTYPKLQDEMTKNIKDKHVDLGLDKLIEDKLQNGRNPYVTKADVPALSGANLFMAKGDIPGNGTQQGIRVSKDTLVNADTIKVGDTVVDTFWTKDIFNIGMFKVASIDGDTITLNGVNDITYRHPKQSLTLADRTLTISDGNSVTLPNDKQTISKQGNKLVLSNGGGEVELPTPSNVTPYDETPLKRRVEALERRPDNDKQTLTLSGNVLSISNGNSVNLPQYVSPQEFNTLKNEYNQLKGAFTALLQNLKDSGAWNQTGGTIFEGSLRPDRNIATGNINLFGGTVDGNAFIRTNNGKTENDLAGGIN